MTSTIKTAACLAICLALAACVSTEPRQPVIDNVTAANYKEKRVRDIAVLPTEGLEIGAPSGIRLPTPELRHLAYRYLIRFRNYAAPKLEWVDEQIANGASGAKAFNTDATLTISIDQWDASSLAGQGVVYAGATFRLVGVDGGELWHFRSTDQRIAVRPPHGGDNTLANLRDAAKGLVEQALDLMPPTPRISVDEIENPK